ncbi:MAG: SUMF1/EgtB/PvdO family nonheme iron enzyme [Burkholderiales bacterium]|nr:SUMF1/EgtB/PvdO family nonheme iron enzyme [Burkholderiales bacterium]
MLVQGGRKALQRADGTAGDDGARTALARADWPAALSEDLLAFSIDASVLQRVGDELRFTHQLLQESLAADVLLSAARSHSRPARDFWLTQNGWARSGWEVVAEIAAEACAGDTPAQIGLIRWLAETAPKVATDIWNHAGQPALPAELLAATKAQWLPRMTDVAAEPEPEARMAIGCWLGALDLDDRAGTGLTPDGLPDIDWVVIDDPRPFVYQEGTHLPLPAFAIARYPVTNRQWQAFVDDGGYLDDRWWEGLAAKLEPCAPSTSQPTSPRERVSWYEAVAFCRWLADRSERDVRLPMETEWERAARGVDGQPYPWGDEWRSKPCNCLEAKLPAPALVGLFPNGRTNGDAAGGRGIEDLAGNVQEWCLNEFRFPSRTQLEGAARRVLRGGSGMTEIERCRGDSRDGRQAGLRGDFIGFRVAVSVRRSKG